MRAAKSNIGNSRLARLELEFQIRGGGGWVALVPCTSYCRTPKYFEILASYLASS
jgi:hypothetical protein